MAIAVAVVVVVAVYPTTQGTKVPKPPNCGVRYPPRTDQQRASTQPLHRGRRSSWDKFVALEQRIPRPTDRPAILHTRQDDDKTNGTVIADQSLSGSADSHHSQLTKEDEAAVGEEVQVRREDQDKINRFSRLHQRELTLQDELKLKVVRPTQTPRTPDAHR